MKILFVCESFSSKLSGGKVVRYLHDILTNRGHEVRIAITSPYNQADTWIKGDDLLITAIPSRTRYYWRLYALANSKYVPNEFSHLVNEFKPDVVHFCSFDHTKSSNLYQYCHERKIRIILQPWTMHFYCAQGFGYKDNQQCTRCITDGLSTAFIQGCTNLRGCLGQLERASLRQMAVGLADIVLSSNSDLDKILQSYGVPACKVRRFPIAFDTSKTLPADTKQGDYYIYYGQANSHKGTDFIIEFFSALSDKKLKLYPMSPYAASKTLPPNIEIISGIGWDNGLREAISNAKAVIVPSLWATSTEYSLCEAMTLRKPVVVFGVGVHKDVLTHRKNAMVVRAGSQKEFKVALDDLEENIDLYNSLAEAGSKRIAEINADSKLYAQLMDAYSSTNL